MDNLGEAGVTDGLRGWLRSLLSAALLSAGFVSAADTAAAHPHSSKPGSSVCKQKGVYEEAGRLCFVDSIKPDTKTALFLLMDRFPGDLTIKSTGGDVRLSWDIGRRIFNEKRGLVVAGPCYSSCANYLVPAAARLEVSPGGVMLLHGSPPRNRVKYAVSVLNSKGLHVGDPKHAAAAQQAFLNFRKHHENFLAPEAQYFVDIAKSNDFVVRYWEVLRNLGTYANDMCDGRNMFLVIGPEYLLEVGPIRASSFWWPSNKMEIVDLLKGFSNDMNFVFDMNLMPSWIAGKGMVKQSDCLKPLD